MPLNQGKKLVVTLFCTCQLRVFFPLMRKNLYLKCNHAICKRLCLSPTICMEMTLPPQTSPRRGTPAPLTVPRLFSKSFQISSLLEISSKQNGKLTLSSVSRRRVIYLCVLRILCKFTLKRARKVKILASSKPVLFFAFPSQTVTVPSSSARTINVDVEDVLHAIFDETFGITIQQSSALLTIHPESTLEELPHTTDNARYTDVDEEIHSDLYNSVDVYLHLEDQDTVNAIYNPSTGGYISVYWSDDDQYYPGRILTLKSLISSRFMCRMKMVTKIP